MNAFNYHASLCWKLSARSDGIYKVTVSPLGRNYLGIGTSTRKILKKKNHFFVLSFTPICVFLLSRKVVLQWPLDRSKVALFLSSKFLLLYSLAVLSALIALQQKLSTNLADPKPIFRQLFFGLFWTSSNALSVIGLVLLLLVDCLSVIWITLIAAFTGSNASPMVILQN